MFGMRKRVFLVEKFVHVLIVLRAFTSHLIPLEVYLGILLFFMTIQYVKEGFTPYVILLVPIVAIQIYGEISSNVFLQYLAALLAGIADFFSGKIYWLPEPYKLAGFREDSLENNLHYYEFYPLDDSKPLTLKKIKWNHGKQLDKMVSYKKINNYLTKKIGHLILSYVDKFMIKIGEGQQLKTNSCIVFSHGRGATPFMSSSILIHFAGKDFKVAAVQHSEISVTDIKQKAQIKKFREKEVQVRALQIYQAILKTNCDRIVLMGHSYGGATIIQAYHTLEPELKRKISHIVLLDPWLFPLSDKKFEEQFDCPVLFLANEDFITHEDMYIRNNEYLKLHSKIEYIGWKNADHLHMCDMGFIAGNLKGIVKNSHLSQMMLDFNMDVIDKFLKGEQVESTVGDRNLGREFKPLKFHPPHKFIF